MHTHVAYQGSNVFKTHVVQLHPEGGFRDATGQGPSVEDFRQHLLTSTHLHIRGDVSNFTATNYLDDSVISLDEDCTDLRNVRLLLPHVHHTKAHVSATQTVLYTRPNNQSPLVEFALKLE